MLVGICACRRAERATVIAGVLVALLGIVAAFAVSLDAFLLTPLATLAIGLSPALRRGLAGIARIVVLAAVAGVAAFPLLRRPSGAPLRG